MQVIRDALSAWPEKAVLLLLATLVVASPLPFALVAPDRRPILGGAAGLILILWSLHAPPRLPRGAVRAALGAGTILVLVGAFQIVPLPRAIVAALAPGRAGLLDRLGAEASGLGAFAALLGLGGGIPGTAWATLSANPEATRRAFLMLAALLVVGASAVLLCRDREAGRRLALCIVAIGTFEALYGLAEYLTGHQHIFGYRKRHYLHSVTGSYINKNHFAGLMEIALLVALGLYWDQRRTARRSPGWRSWLVSLSDARRGASGLLLLAIGLTGSALLLSFSRSGIAFGLVTAVALLCWLGAGREGSVARAARSVAMVAVVLAPLAWFGRHEIAASFAQVPSDAEAPGGRQDLWLATAGIVGDYPVFGTGLGTFRNLLPHYATPAIHRYFDHAHNGYLEIASGVGLPAAALAVAAVLWLLARALGAARRAAAGRGLAAGAAAACAALLLHELTDFNLAIPANALLFSVCLGIAAGTALQAAGGAPEPARPAGRRARAAGTALALLMLAESSTEYLAAERAGRGRDLAAAAAAGTTALAEEAVRLARAATGWRPGDSEAQGTLAIALATLAERRLEKDPNPPPPAEAEAMVRDLGTAVAASIRANPWDATNYARALTALHLASRLRPEARDLSAEPVVGPIAGGIAGTIVWLAPTSTTGHRAMGGYLLGAGDLEGAAASYRRVVEIDPSLAPAIARYLFERLPDPRWIDRVIPDEAEAQRLYGDFLADAGQVGPAERAYLASLRKRRSPAVAVRLHDLYAASCRPAAARDLVRGVLAAAGSDAPPERAELRDALARSRFRSGDLQGAIASLESAVAEAPERPLYGHRLASLVAMERPADAVRIWTRILDRHRASPEMPQLRAEIYLGMARAYEKEGRTLEALREYRHVLVDRPADPAALGRIALLESGAAATAASLDEGGAP
ncbi:MAG: O-antigen ligase family protein [Acidobacteria bacterium]|nr:O-antigen ligase family protein [Acidobacteriota bacterium]